MPQLTQSISLEQACGLRVHGRGPANTPRADAWRTEFVKTFLRNSLPCPKALDYTATSATSAMTETNFYQCCRLEHSTKRELGYIPRIFFCKLPFTMQRHHHPLLTWSSSSNVYIIPPIRHLLARSRKLKEGSKVSNANPQDGV